MFLIKSLSQNLSLAKRSLWLNLTTEGGDGLRDTVIIIALICITALALTAMVIVGTYFKDKLMIKSKFLVGKATENEISITAEEKNSKN